MLGGRGVALGDLGELGYLVYDIKVKRVTAPDSEVQFCRANLLYTQNVHSIVKEHLLLLLILPPPLIKLLLRCSDLTAVS